MSKDGNAGAVPGLLRVETRRGAALLLSPAILAVAWWLAWSGTYGPTPVDLSTGVYVWEATSGAVKDSVLTIGPLAAGLSAWAAGRNRRRGMEDLLSTTARPPVHRDLLTWAGSALPLAGVYVLLAFLLGVQTALNATWGAPVPGYVLVGLVALLTDSAFGFAAGRWLPGRFTAPLVAVALYAAHLLPTGASDYRNGVGLLSPAAYGNISGLDVFHEVPRMAPQQILLFGGLGVAALASVALKGGAHRASRVVLAAALVVACAGLVAALKTENPHYYKAKVPVAVPFKPVCGDGRVTVCVHPAYAKLLPETARAVNKVAGPLAGVPGAPTRAVQVSPQGNPPKGFDKDKTLPFSAPGSMVKEEVAYGLVMAGSDATPGRGARSPRRTFGGAGVRRARGDPIPPTTRRP